MTPDLVETCKCPTHPLILLSNSLFFFLAPLLFLYNGGDEADYSLGRTQAITVFTAVAGGVIVAANRDAVFVYNAILCFHLAVEVYVVDRAFRYANASSTPGWASTGAVVVLLHLLPFFLIPNARLWSVLAYVGLIVNTALILLAMPELGSRLLLLTGMSASALLSVSISCLEKKNASPCPSSVLLSTAKSVTSRSNA